MIRAWLALVAGLLAIFGGGAFVGSALTGRRAASDLAELRAGVEEARVLHAECVRLTSLQAVPEADKIPPRQKRHEAAPTLIEDDIAPDEFVDDMTPLPMQTPAVMLTSRTDTGPQE